MGSVAAVRDEAPYDWQRDFQWRLSQARPEDTARGLFFNGTLEAIRSLGGEAVVAECLAVSGQERFVDFFSYPMRVHLLIVATALRELRLDPEGTGATLRQLGRRAGLDFLASAAGRVMMVLSKRDRRALLSSLPSAYGVSVSFGEQSVVWTGPRSGRFVLKRDFMPVFFHEGVLEAVLERSGARGVEVRGGWMDGLDSECEFSWQ
jgi:uncharacterized protein (TIGR02265 family)